jgi:hypothetical protein
MADSDLSLPLGATLHSAFTDVAPVMDGAVDEPWAAAPALAVRMHHGLHGSDLAGTMQLRSLHDEEQVYFLARWSSPEPGGEPDAWRNLMTMHWRLVDPGLVSGESTGSEGLACTVACHTATADGQGKLVGIRDETIPPGIDDDLPAGGGWAQGLWTLEWSRPRVSASPYNQNIVDPEQGYRFFVKLFQRVEGLADPVSDIHELRLSP